MCDISVILVWITDLNKKYIKIIKVLQTIARENNYKCNWGFIFKCIYITIFLYSIKQAKEKRGWTLNSAGYLLGPREFSNTSLFFCLSSLFTFPQLFMKYSCV